MRMVACSAGIIIGVFLAGCTPGSREAKPGASAGKGEEEVKTAFASLQAAVKAKDGDKIWSLLDKDSQADADREAKAVKEAFGKLADKDKSDFEKKLALSADELSNMTGKLYLKSQRFYGKHYEIFDSTVKSIKLDKDAGQLTYEENDDHDKVTLALTREGGQWKFAMKIPKAVE